MAGGKIRYFHVTVFESMDKFTICEYLSDFGKWAYDNAPTRFNSVHNGQIWLIFSEIPLVATQAKFVETKLMDRAITWQEVNLKSIPSLPVKLQKNTQDFTRRKK